MTNLERRFTITGAYDLTRPKPQENYGIHCMEMHFVVIGPKGAVNVNMYLPWYLPHLAASIYASRQRYPFNMLPNITDVGYHAKEPQYEDQSPMPDCSYTGGACYYDGSSLWGNESWREGFLHGGSEWLWERLEEYYHHRFEDGPSPNLTPIPRKHPKEV